MFWKRKKFIIVVVLHEEHSALSAIVTTLKLNFKYQINYFVIVFKT